MKIASIYIPRVSLALMISDAVVSTVFLIAATTVSFDSHLAWLNHLVVPGAVLAGLILGLAVTFVLLCNFAMGLYQRRYMKGRKLIYSATICTAIGLIVFLFTDNLLLGNSFRFAELAVLVVTLYVLLAASRPLFCAFYETFVPKRRLALIGSYQMAEQVRLAIERASPTDAVLVTHYTYDRLSGGVGLDASVQAARCNPEIDEIFVEMSAADLRIHSGAMTGRPLN
ncbi:MAG: hypothetical protein WBC93_09570, partial [Sulfitobacter sp.]